MTIFLNKIITFIKSLYKHTMNGSPKSSQKLIDLRYEICLNCESFDKDNSQCKQCGCNINNQKILLNKLAWADQQCPLQKW